MKQAPLGTVLHRRLFWATTAVMSAGWIAVLLAAAMGERGNWPGWVVMGTNTVIFATSPLVRSHSKGAVVQMVVVMMLSVLVIIGLFVK